MQDAGLDAKGRHLIYAMPMDEETKRLMDSLAESAEKRTLAAGAEFVPMTDSEYRAREKINLEFVKRMCVQNVLLVNINSKINRLIRVQFRLG